MPPVPAAPEQPPRSAGCGGEPVSQLPGLPLCLQWHRPAGDPLCGWQALHWRHDALVPECLVSVSFRSKHTHWRYTTWFCLNASSAAGRMNLCTTVTESDIARGKNALKASLVAQLNGAKGNPWFLFCFCLCFLLCHTHISLSCSSCCPFIGCPRRNDSHLRRHRQARPQLRPSYPVGWVGRSHRREFSLSALASSAASTFLLWLSLPLIPFRLSPPRWCVRSAPNISMISVLLLQLLVSCCFFVCCFFVPVVS